MLVDLTLKVPDWNKNLQVGDDDANAQLIATGHVGTHLDRYLLTDIPLEYFRSPGVCFDVRGIVKRDITEKDVPPGEVKAGDFVLLHTGWIEEHPYGTRPYAMEHPQLAPALLDALIAKGVRFIGLDCPGVRRHTQHKPADEKSEAGGVYIIENMVGLGRLPRSGFTVYCLWVGGGAASGLQCRVLAEIPD